VTITDAFGWIVVAAGSKLGRHLSWTALRAKAGASQAAETCHDVTKNWASEEAL